MGSFVNPDMKSGIKINGIDILDIHPDQVREIIASDKTGILKAQIQEKLNEFEDSVVMGRDDYAKAYGRPSLEEMPFGTCENDGYKYLDGHAPNCDGPDDTYVGGCWCAQFTSIRDHITGYNFHNKPLWPGGPILDDFDM